MHQSDNVTEHAKTHIAENFTNTELGLVRIARNLDLEGMAVFDVVRHCYEIIMSTPAHEIEIRGKNYYLRSQQHRAVLTINRSSLAIITAKRIDCEDVAQPNDLS